MSAQRRLLASVLEFGMGVLGAGAAHAQIFDMGFSAIASSQDTMISCNFNGTAIPAGRTIWFSSVFKL